MTHPDATIVRERVADGPTRRIVYAPRDAGGYLRREQLWRESLGRWHTTGTEIVTDLTIERPTAAPTAD